MATREIIVPVPGAGPAILFLEQPVTAESLGRLEQGIAGALTDLRHQLAGDNDAPGIVEYESWIHRLRAAA